MRPQLGVKAWDWCGWEWVGLSGSQGEGDIWNWCEWDGKYLGLAWMGWVGNIWDCEWVGISDWSVFKCVVWSTFKSP